MSAGTLTDPAPGRAERVEAQAADWLARLDGDGWTDADAAALAAWLEAATAHRVAFLRLQSAWQETGRLQALGAGWQGQGVPPRGIWHAAPGDRRAQLLQAIAARPPARPRPRTTGARWRLATAAGIVSCALFAGWVWRDRQHVDAASFRNAVGEIATQALADGSSATLAGDSRIEVRLSRGERRVDLLRGEAIFAVAKDPSRPFVVATDGYDVVAVGTRFSVRRDEPGLRVVVTEGTVRLQSPAAGDAARPSALLPAGSVALVTADGVLVQSMAASEADHLLGWRDGMLAFRDTPLSQAVAEFNRYNTRQLVIGDAGVAALRIGGNFRGDNADGFVRLLEAGFPVRAERQDQRIVLRSR